MLDSRFCILRLRDFEVVLLHEDTELALVLDLDHLLAAIGRLSQGQHPVSSPVSSVKMELAHTYEMLSFMVG